MRAAIVFLPWLFLAPLAGGGDFQRAGRDDDVFIDSLMVRGMPIRGFAELITRSCGARWTVMVSEGAAAKSVDMYLESTHVEEALKALCASYGLWFKRTPGSRIVQIMTLDEFRGGLNLYAEEAVEVITLKYPHVEEVCETLQKVFLDRVVWSRSDKDENDPYDRLERALDRMELLADRATIADVGSMTSASAGSLSSSSSSSGSRNSNYRNSNYRNSPTGSGGSSANSDGRTLSQLLQEREDAEALLRSMTGEEVRRMIDGPESGGGMDRPGLVYVSAMIASNDIVLRSNDPISLAKVKQVALSLDKPRPQVLLEVKILDVTLVDEHERGIDWLLGGGAISAGSARGMSGNQGQLISRPDSTLVPQGTGLDGRAAVFGVVTEHVRARLQLLQDNDRVVTLATPNLLVADNEASRVFIGTEMTVLEKVDTTRTEQEYGDGVREQIEVTVQAPRRRIGTSLLITPKIHADRSVTISILQENTALGVDREIIVGINDSFVSTNVEERSVTTTVVAHDGHIIAIGGLITEKSGKRVVGVPGLHKVPIVGELFKRTSKTQERHEMLILIKPCVLLAPGEGEAESLDMMERLSRHPSAHPDFPNLGVGDSREMPVGEWRGNSRDDLRRLKERSPVMSMEP
ncbi:MAG: hypothetical protein LBE84_11290 [Planctomycetota bacterium]|jgi:general secretion pathway protein D|nr:hypothetical protein [Planctomycetota bacterium]